MKRLPLFLLLALATYLGLLGTLSLGLSAGPLSLAKVVWFGCAAATLSNCAFELTLLPYWAWLKLSGRLACDPYVSLSLSESDAGLLAELEPPTAILMPAHNEATTPADREDLVERLVDILCLTPAWSMVFLLFDSPPAQTENEWSVVEEVGDRLRQMNRHREADRLRFVEYRNKPIHMRNKPGSIVLWLAEFAARFDFFFVLDADSSLAPADADDPAQQAVLQRLVVAMLRYPRLAMIQSAIQIRTYQTAWGWFQWLNADMGSRYHGPLMQWLLGEAVPSYGHNVLFRTQDFLRHVRNSLDYLSHDFLDAADLATAGKLCVFTHRAVTFEQAEESLLGYAIRELRWARGNAQWLNYWLTKSRLPLGPRVFIGLGILSYVWPLGATVLLVSSAALVGEGGALMDVGRPGAVRALTVLVFVSLLVPRAIAARDPAKFTLGTLLGLCLSPAIMVLRGCVFLIGIFGAKWSPRGARSLRLDLDHIGKLGAWFYPVAAFGLVLQLVFLRDAAAEPGAMLLQWHVLMLVASPLAACVCSCVLPWKAPRRLLP